MRILSQSSFLPLQTEWKSVSNPFDWADRDTPVLCVRFQTSQAVRQLQYLLKTNDTLSLWDCISLDAAQKGRTIHEDIAQDLLKRGLIEDDAPHYSISLSIAKTRINFLLIQKQKDWIRRSCVKWFYNILAMQEAKVPSEIAYTNISKMCFQPRKRKSNDFAMSADY